MVERARSLMTGWLARVGGPVPRVFAIRPDREVGLMRTPGCWMLLVALVACQEAAAPRISGKPIVNERSHDVYVSPTGVYVATWSIRGRPRSWACRRTSFWAP